MPIINPNPITVTANKMWVTSMRLTPDKVVFRLQPCGDNGVLDSVKVVVCPNTDEVYDLLVSEAKRLTGFAQISYVFLTAPFNKNAYLWINQSVYDFWALYNSDEILRSKYDEILSLIGGKL